MKTFYYLFGTLGLLLLPLHSFSQYCTPSFSNGCGGNDRIDGVVFGTINNTSNGCSPASYGDFTLMSNTVAQTLTYNITVNNTPDYGEGIGVFIDWNQDSDFNNPGEFYGNNNVTPAGGTEVIQVTVPAGAVLGTTRMRVVCNWNTAINSTGSCGGWSYGEAEDYSLDIVAAPACGPATALNVTNLVATSADLNWTAASLAVNYTIEWGPVGFTPGTATQSDMATGVAATSTSATGLSSQTSYDFYVQTNCGGATSPWAGPVSFTTPCTSIMAPFMETFTGTSTPICWNQSASTGGPWVFTGNPGYAAGGALDHTNGSQNNYAWIDYSSTDVAVILESPIIDVSALTSPEVRFWLWSHYAGTLTPYNFTYVEANDGTGWQQLMVVQGDYGPQWTQFSVVVPQALYLNATSIQIRFRGESGGSSGDYYNDILLDDVSVTEAPTCPAPTDLTLISSNTTSVNYSWTEVGSATEWKIEYGQTGFVPGIGAGTVEMVTTNPDDIQSLMPNSFYDVYVQSACSPGDTSFLLGPLSFNTFNQGAYMEADAECGVGFIDIAATGTDLLLLDDTEAGITLPFTWLVQGTQVNQITVGNNGGLLLNTLSGNVGYTMTSGDGFYPFIQDLDHRIAGVSQVGVLWEVVGTAPNRKFVVLWKDRTRYPGSTNINPCTFEFIYDEATNEVYYTYPDTDFGNANFDFGKDAEIGFSGAQNVNVSINSATYLQENSCVHLYYTNCPKPSDLINQYITADEAGYSWTTGLSNEPEWLVVYGVAGFDPATSGTQLTTTTANIVLSNITQLTEYDVYVFALCASIDTSLAIMGNFTSLPLCADVSSLSTATGVDSLFGSWSWTAFDPQYNTTGFTSVYGDLGFDPTGSGTTFNGDTLFNSDTITNTAFLAGGVYELYVQAVCDTLKSNMVGPIMFTMPLTNDSACGAETLLLDGIAHAFSNTGATVQQGEIGIAPPVSGAQQTDGWSNNNIDYTTWFKFTAPTSGMIRVSGIDIEYNGQVAVYEVANCGLFSTFNLKAANDDEIDGTSQAPNFTFCELTPGNEYYLMHDAGGNVGTGIYSLKFSGIDLNAGTANPVTSVCSKDTVSLFTGISGNDIGGMWVDLENTFHIVNGSDFNTSGLAYETYKFEYRLEDGCALDSIITSFKVFPPSQAGNDGSMSICKNEPTGLLSALGGTITTGGTWFDSNGTPLPSSNIGAGVMSIAGTYNFSYVVGNGVCKNDSSIVTVTVLNTCDWLGIDDMTVESLTVYPNPTSDRIYISNTASANDFELILMDVNGRVIYSDAKATIGTQAYEINMVNVENGVYLVKLTKGNSTQMVRVVKQ
jgi:hypothetical protein